jgi:hypothetical protein
MLHTDISRYLPAESEAERAIAAASRAHCTAFPVLGDGPGQRMQAESHLELCHFLLLNANRLIVHLQEQVRFTYGRGERQIHVFDVVATWACGKRIAYTIKPEARLRSGRFLAEMQEIAWWARGRAFADDIRLLTEQDVDPIALHNARIVAAVREPDPDADAIARETAGALTGAVTLRELTAATGLEARGYRALLRLVRGGELRPVHHERLAPHSLVLWNGAVQ